MADSMNLAQQLKKFIPAALQPLKIAEKILMAGCLDGKVASGPFQGLRYESESIGSVYLPKILGIYEQELHQEINECLSRNPRHIIDIGAAEGYYAVGIASKCEGASVLAFETEDKGQALIRRMAALNHVQDQIQIRGFCSAADLQQALIARKPELMIVDIEGGEVEVLSEQNAALLTETTLMVETHPWIAPGVNEILTARFKHTHVITTILSQQRSVGDLKLPAHWKLLFGRWLSHLINERRPIQMTWLIMKPKSAVP
jgi:hypothetical protein